MKTFIASDFHGRSPKNLVDTLYSNGKIDNAIFLGDYDEPFVLKDILELEINKIVLVGNHDYDFAHGNEVYSPSLHHSQEKYLLLWGNSNEGDYIREAAKNVEGTRNGLRVVRKSGKNRIAYVHGGIINDYSGGLPLEVWSRLVDTNEGFSQEKKVAFTFKEMERSNYNILFRGHDHFSGIFSSDNYGKVESSWGGVLDTNKRHIVNIGPFVGGNYALFDEKNEKLEFCVE